MGTRADFYVGTGKDAEWLGSLAFDGYRIDEMKYQDVIRARDKYREDYEACLAIKTATDEASYRAAVTALLALNDDATLPSQGWPWPWDDSSTTDYVYAFVDGRCITCHGSDTVNWPDMSERKNVTFGKRSGMIVIGPEGPLSDDE